MNAYPEDFVSNSIPAGELLWHYTDFAGLDGIVKGTLWASSLPYLNDTEEFHYGRRLAHSFITQELSGNAAPLRALRSMLDQFLSRYRPNDVFVASLSRERDDLSQWRAYGGKNATFSVGFDPRALEAKAAEYLFELYEVKYEEAEVAADLRSALEDPLGKIKQAASEGMNDAAAIKFANTWGPELAVVLMVLAPRYKHPAFSAEREWRLIRRQPVLPREPSLPHQYRLSGSLVVPYLAMPLHDLPDPVTFKKTGESVPSPVAAIITGPSPHPDELVYAVGDMTARKGLALLDVKPSSVPFRNW